MTVMKSKYILMSVAAAGLSMTACSDDFLEVTSPTDTFIEEYYTTENSIDEALVAAYAPLHWYDYGSTWNYCPLNFMADILADDLYPNGSSNADQPFIQQMFQFKATPVMSPEGLWSDSYSGVKRSNDVLAYLPNIKGLSDEKKASIEAQARLLRVFYYNVLWKFYGNIPCYLENLAAPYIYPQSTADEAYNIIITELEDVIKNCALKNDWENSEKGRVTKPLAYMIYAEMVMIQNDNSRYAQALSYMEEMISSGNYDLMPEFIEIWDEENEWCKESIFEINYFSESSTRGWNNQLGAGGSVSPRLWGPRNFKADSTNPHYANIEGGWGFGAIPTATVKIFDSADKRLEGSIIDLNANGTSDDPGWMNTGYHQYKYAGKQGGNAGQKADADLGFNNNLRVYRYAETLLNAAELLVLTNGDNAKATKYVNLVRSRAGIDALGTVNQDDIINERRHEFIGEGKRYFDLVRTGKAAQVLTADKDPYRDNSWTEAVRYMPIPQSNIDAAKGTLTQNGNY